MGITLNYNQPQAWLITALVLLISVILFIVLP